MVQEARLKHAMADLNKAQAQLDDKQKELDAVQALYDSAVNEKQVYQAPLLHQGKNLSCVCRVSTSLNIF